MINEILQAAGFEKDKTYRRSRFLSPPAGTYVVYLDDKTTDGPDGINSIITHDYTVEVYASAPDDQAEESIEQVLDSKGLRWTKQDRYWLQTEQRYQTIYEFTYIEKRRA